MMKRRLCLILVFVVLWSIPVSAGSLFTNARGSLFTDSKARDVGDLVTVIIVEQAQASQSANTSSGKDASVAVGPGVGVLADLIPLISVGARDDFSAAGSTSRGGSLTAQLTTRVVERYPNGTMRIEGRQRIVINSEEQEIIVSGLIRSQDLATNNTVLSTSVADAEIEFRGAGVIGDKQRPGLLTRLFNWLF